jgi:hypothetical protein
MVGARYAEGSVLVKIYTLDEIVTWDEDCDFCDFWAFCAFCAAGEELED